MAGAAANSPGLLSPVTTKSTVWPDSSAGPGEIAVANPATVCGPASSATVWFAPALKVGASLTGVTLIVMVLADGSVSTPPLAVPPLSCTWNVNEASGDPLALAAGKN